MVIPNLKNCKEYILNLKQKDIAIFFNLSQSTVSGWESGIDTMPIKHIITYTNYFEISLDYLFGITNQNITYTKITLSLKKLCNNLRILRLKNNMTQSEVAEKLNTSQAS